MKTIALAALAAVGFTQIPLRGLTAEEAQILSHLSLVQQPDGQGGMVPTLVVTGVNVQIVNGAGPSAGVNGTGNLIVGYNEFGNIHGDERTGSHSIVFGNKANFTSSGCLVGGIGNIANGVNGVILAGTQNWIAPGVFQAVIGSGAINEIHATSGVVIAGSGNRIAAPNSVIVGGVSNTAGEGFAAVVGGGQGNTVQGTAAVVSGGTARIATSNGSWAGGQFYSPN